MLEPLQFISASAINVSLVMAPALLYAALKRSRAVAICATITVGLFMLQALVLSLPNVGWLSLLRMNWLQKLCMFGLTVLVARILHCDAKQWGFSKPDDFKLAFLWALLLGLVTTIPSLIEIVWSQEGSKFAPEYFLFQLTMPGLHEEPLYRGLLLYLWDNALGRPISFLGTKMGMGALITSTLFVLGHTFTFDHSFHPLIAPVWVWLDLSFFAVAMVWLRYKCNSFWPALQAHNFGNAAQHLAQVIYSKFA